MDVFSATKNSKPEISGSGMFLEKTLIPFLMYGGALILFVFTLHSHYSSSGISCRECYYSLFKVIPHSGKAVGCCF